MTSAPHRANGFFAGLATVARRELGATFDSSVAYVFTIGFLLLANSIFMNDFFLTGRVDMSGFFELLPLLLPFFLAASTMRLWVEERRVHTDEFLLTLPITPLQAVLGKFVAAFALYAVFVAGTLPIPLMLNVLGRPDGGLILGGYLGLIGLGALLTSLGLCLSSLSSDQVTAFVLTASVGIALVLLGDPRVVAVVDGLAPSLSLGTLLAERVSARRPYDALTGGTLAPSALVYFGGLSAVLLWINAAAVERNRS